ncbi:LamB/YcsF family protein [Corynebacterium kalinowskii]|uniref:5-oxoprolinase subunit A n=2 Tax=Corynebacterium kalinowskii TaxID=2675216 RepID=A0A6B8VLX4_9CORY|nr:LamB/YcsF family protein [Corynebacterium kalinowskii]
MFDLNSDMGESFGAFSIGNDGAVLKLVSSANIATGFHAGDPLVMVSTVQTAIAHGVRIGAHIGYQDIAGFGRRDMEYDPKLLEAETIYQIGALQAIARSLGAEVAYVKPHGALYNRIAFDPNQAEPVIAGIKAADPSLKLMGLAGSPVLQWAADAGLGTISEAFADRAYTPEGKLVPRSQPGAVLHDPVVAAAQALAFALGEPITAIDGSKVHVRAESLCVHGDNPAALVLIEHIRQKLSDAGVGVGHDR